MGAATFFADAVGNFGGVTGTFFANNGSPAVFGENVFTGGSFSLEISNYFVPFFNVPSTQIFDPDLVSSTHLFPNRTATSTYHMVDNFGQKASFSGAYFWFLPSDDPADYIDDDDVLAHVEFVMDTLPDGWLWFLAGFESYVFTAGPNTGVAERPDQGDVFIRSGCRPVPLPAALPLLGMAIGSLVMLRRRAGAVCLAEGGAGRDRLSRGLVARPPMSSPSGVSRRQILQSRFLMRDCKI